MDYNNVKVVELKALSKEHGLRGYSRLKKAELITFLQNNLQPLQLRATGPQNLLDLFPQLRLQLDQDS